MLEILLNLMGKVALLVALGYILAKRGFLTERFQKDLTSFMMQVALPANVLTTASNPFSPDLSQNLLLTVGIAVVYYAAAFAFTFFVRRFLPLDEKGRAMFTLMAVFANTAFLGFPLITELLGQEGLLYAVIFNMVWLVFFFTIGISMVSGQRQIRLKSILSMPVSLASLAAVVLYVSPFRFPVFVQDTLSTLGAMVVPISILLIGCSLVPIRPVEVLKDPWSYFVSALRLAVFPLAVLVLLKYSGLAALAPNGETILLVSFLASATPAASAVTQMSQVYGPDGTYAGAINVSTTLLCIITMPLLITLYQL